MWHAQRAGSGRRREEGAAANRRGQRQRRCGRSLSNGVASVCREGRSEPWKIAVLVRSRSLLGDIVAELKDETKGAIPFRAVDIEALGERQEVLDLFALTRALLHPADRVAWLAVLHAPWCGLGLADLHTLAGADDPAWAERCIEDSIAERGELLSEESCAQVAACVARAAGARVRSSGRTDHGAVGRTDLAVAGR